MTQDTTWENDKNTIKHHKQGPRGQPFPSIKPQDSNEQTPKHKKQDINNTKWSTKDVPPWNGLLKYFTGGIKPVSQRQLHP